MSSLKKIAEELSVSVATVSNALSGKGKLSPALREEIIHHAKTRGYEPSLHARVLHGKRMPVLGLILPSAHDGLAQRFIDGAEQRAAKAGYSILVATTHRDGEDVTHRELSAVERFHSLRIGGVLYLSAAHGNPRKVEKRMTSLGLPFARLYRQPPEGKAPAVIVNHASGVRKGISHLLEHGHRRIVILHSGPFQGPEIAFARAVYNEYFPRRDWALWNVSPEDHWRTFWAAHRRGATAAMALSDDLAFSACRMLEERGIAVPSAFSLVGFRDTIVARTMTPGLTTLHVPADQIAAQATHWLIEHLEEGHPLPSQTEALEPQLIIRTSTAAPGR